MLKRKRTCESHPFNVSIRVENLQILEPSTESIYLIHPETNSQMFEGSTEDILYQYINMQILEPFTGNIHLIHPQTNSQMLEGSTEDILYQYINMQILEPFTGNIHFNTFTNA